MSEGKLALYVSLIVIASILFVGYFEDPCVTGGCY